VWSLQTDRKRQYLQNLKHESKIYLYNILIFGVDPAKKLIAFSNMRDA
jgi:hypothetical protein